MKIGIIAEFNPMHTGHIHLINTTKAQFPHASIYVIMSTYFTQRGEPSFIDPYTKVQLALANGVDFVFELPPFFSTQRADVFARGAVLICQQLELDAIAFGVEDIQFFTESKQTDTTIIPSSQPFLQRITSFNSTQAQTGHWNASANNILAHFYIENSAKHAPQLQCIPIQRIGANYHETHLQTQFASATAIRKSIIENNAVKITPFIPYSPDYLQENLSWDQLFSSFKHIITTHSTIEQMATIGKSGLHNRFLNAAHNLTFEAFITAVKTKAYTRTSIQRAMLFTLLNITQEELDYCTKLAEALPPRLIGFHKQKSHQLKNIPHTLDVKTSSPLFNNTYKKFEAVYRLHIKTNPHQHFPFIFEENMA